MKLRQLTHLLSIRSRFHFHWNLTGTVKPVPSSKSVSPPLKPLIDRKMNTYIGKFQSFTMLSEVPPSLRSGGETLYRWMRIPPWVRCSWCGLQNQATEDWKPSDLDAGCHITGGTLPSHRVLIWRYGVCSPWKTIDGGKYEFANRYRR